MSTTAYKARLALANDDANGLLQTWDGLKSVKAHFGWPGEVPDNEVIWLAGVKWPIEEWATATRSTRNEEYEIGLFLVVRAPGYSQQDTTKRLYDLFEEIQKCLRQDVRNPLGVSGVYQVELKPRHTEEGTLDNGRWSSMYAVIRICARH